MRELRAPQTPKLDLRWRRIAAEREGREGDGVREGEEREGRDNERRDGSKGKRWALADLGGKGTMAPGPWLLKMPDIVLFLCMS